MAYKKMMQEAKEEGLSYSSPIGKAGAKIVSGETGGQVITVRTGAIKSSYQKGQEV